LLSSFTKAKRSPRTEVPFLMIAFERVAGGRNANDAEEGSPQSGLDGYGAPDRPLGQSRDPGPEKKR